MVKYLYPLGTEQCFVLPHPSMQNQGTERHHGCVPGDKKGHSNVKMLQNHTQLHGRHDKELNS